MTREHRAHYVRKALGSRTREPKRPSPVGADFARSAGSIRHTSTCACSSKIRGTPAAGAAPGRLVWSATGFPGRRFEGGRECLVEELAKGVCSGGGVPVGDGDVEGAESCGGIQPWSQVERRIDAHAVSQFVSQPCGP